jgi:hypothetical protein
MAEKLESMQSASWLEPRTVLQSNSLAQWQEGLNSEKSMDSCEGKPLEGRTPGA